MKNRQKALLKPSVGMQDQTLHFLYETAVGRAMLKVLISPCVSKLGGCVLSTRLSSLAVDRFVKANNIDLTLCQKRKFDSFNDFFTRKLKKGARPVEMDTAYVVSPCDGALSVYPITEKSLFTIKNSIYTVKQLLQNEALAKRYEGGNLWLYRLCVDDYHRYIYPFSGRKSEQQYISGVFHTVNPIANERYLIYKENTREYCLIQTEECGTVLMMEVGAMMVGKIENHVHREERVKRGKEKGNFAFGGSTIIVLTQKGMAEPNLKILKNTARGIETKVKLGEIVGNTKKR